MAQEQKKDKKVLNVAMFGGFSMRYDGIPLVFGRSYRLKYIQLFQLLLLNQSNGIAKDVLLENLYGMQNGANRNNSLNNLIFRLRRHLMELGFSEKDDIILKNGRCFLISEEEIELDVSRFQMLIEEAKKIEDGREKAELLYRAVELYQGELLPEISTELWVTAESMHYKRQMEEAVRILGEYWWEQKRFYELRMMYRRLSQIYPFENWQEKEIECLMTMNKSQEAYQIYENTVNMYIDELGVPPSGEYLKRFRKMERGLCQRSESLWMIQEELREQKPSAGAYYCSYPSFIDSYRLMFRLMERNGQSVFLMLCTLVDGKGNPLENQKIAAQKMEWLFEAMGSAMRQGDVYTKYSSCQYLALLLGTNQEDCFAISQRIDQKYQKLSTGMRREVRYYVTSLASPVEKEEEEKKNFHKRLEPWKNN